MNTWPFACKATALPTELISLLNILISINPREIWTPALTVKMLCLNQSWPLGLYIKNINSLMQVSHSLLPITKRLHYFYAKKAKKMICNIISIIKIISTLYLKMFSFLQLKPINYYKIYNNYSRSVLLRKKKYNKVCFAFRCFQHLSLTDVAFLPCLCCKILK